MNILLKCAVLGITISLLSIAPLHAQQVSISVGDTKTNASVRGVGQITLFKKEDDTAGERKDVFLVSGSIICKHPDFDEPKGFVDPRLYHHAEVGEVAVEAKAGPPGTKSIVVSGPRLILDISKDPWGRHVGFNTFCQFLPGVVWNVKEEIPFGFANKAEGKIRRLAPGSYKIGPYGAIEKHPPAKKPQQGEKNE